MNSQTKCHNMTKEMAVVLIRTSCSCNILFSILSRLWPGLHWNWESMPGRGITVFCSPNCQDWLWYPISLLFNGYCRLFSEVQSSQGVKLTTHPTLSSVTVKSLQIYNSIPTRNTIACTGTSLPLIYFCRCMSYCNFNEIKYVINWKQH